MRVTEIGVTVRLSKEVRGAWKSMEFSAKAELDGAEAEHWREKQAELCGDLRQQLNSLFPELSDRRTRSPEPGPESGSAP